MVFWATPRTRRAATAAMRSRAPSPSLTASCSGRADGSGGTGLDRGPHRLGDRQILNGDAGQVHHHPFVVAFTQESLRAANVSSTEDLLVKTPGVFLMGRSVERRVGKGCVNTCRSGWTTYHYKKNTDTY